MYRGKYDQTEEELFDKTIYVNKQRGFISDGAMYRVQQMNSCITKRSTENPPTSARPCVRQCVRACMFCGTCTDQ